MAHHYCNGLGLVLHGSAPNPDEGATLTHAFLYSVLLWLEQVLAAVSSVSLCEGFREYRKQDVDVTASPATPTPVAGVAGFSSLSRQAGVPVGRNSSSSPRAVGEGANEGSLVSAKLGVAGGNTAVQWSSTCSRVLPARAAMDFPLEQQVGDAARRCSECREFLVSGLLPRLWEVGGGGGGAATGGNGGVTGGGCCLEEGREVAPAADKVRQQLTG